MATTREFRRGEHVVVIRESGGTSAQADGRAYVLVHGLGMAHEYWQALAELLEPSGTVYALDLPGFGDAPQPSVPLSMAESGELVAALLVAEGIDHPVLVGHSAGAQVVAETTARHPELVDRLVLIGPTVNPRERTIAQQSLRFVQDVAVINPKVTAIGLAQYAEAGPKWFIANLRPMIDHHLERVLPQIEADTLVIRGEHDRVVPRYWAEEVAALVPKGRYAEVPGRGHDAILTSTAQVGELILRHANGEPAGRPVSQPQEPMKAMQLSWPQALGSWALDYLYAGVRQLAFLTEGRRPPARWRTGDLAKPQVVLLPGVYEHWSFLRPLGDALNADGHRVLAVHGMGVNRRPIAATAAGVARALARVAAPEAGRVIVAHSKGGLIGKHLLLDERADALGLRGLVAVCTPFAGARRARLFTDPSIRALLPSDETIVMLGNSTSVNGRIVSVFGTFDPHIPDGSALDGATNVRVPAAGHFRVLGAPETLLAVRDGIALLTAAADWPDGTDAKTADASDATHP
jgi:pimeloyl-ACP methyl ester carboxylesterase